MTECASESHTGKGLGWEAPAPLPLDIDTPRLTIRRYTLDDASALHALINANREHLLPYVPFARTKHFTPENTGAFVAEMIRCAAEPGGPHPGDGALFPGIDAPIVEKATGKIIGTVCLHSVRPDTRSCEIGYWVDKDLAGQGYATEATRCWISHLLRPVGAGGLGFRRLRVFCSGHNAASRRVAEKLGVPLEVHQRANNHLPDFGTTDQLGWGVVDDEWDTEASAMRPGVEGARIADEPLATPPPTSGEHGFGWQPRVPLLIDIVTPRLRLRTYRASDGPEMFKLINENRAHLVPFMPWARSQHQTVEASEAYCATQAHLAAEPKGHGVRNGPAARPFQGVGIVIEERETGDLVGATGLHDVRPETASCETGYWVSADRARRGYCTEAMRYWLRHLLSPTERSGLGLKRVRMYCSSENAASIGVCEKLGIRKEVHQRDDYFVEDLGVTDRLGWGVLASEWDTIFHRVRDASPA
ncbi:MAG: GNAT family N-acetyltransferase [Planctomycetota bacterium]